MWSRRTGVERGTDSVRSWRATSRPPAQGVVAVTGRDPDRTRDAAARLATAHGHEIEAVDSVEALLERGLDALVVASADPVTPARSARRCGLRGRRSR